jgi:hypothetical protein
MFWVELYEKILTIIGLGATGIEVAKSKMFWYKHYCNYKTS